MNQNLDTIDEKREQALIRLATYQQKVARYFNRNVRYRTFKEGDWVVRKVFKNTKEVGEGKLEPNWEGPYIVTKVLNHEAYKLQTESGKTIQNSWNAIHLKKYHR